MNAEEAERLVDRLVAAWPGIRWQDPTIVAYVDALEPVDHQAGTAAVERAIRSLDKPPPLATLVEFVRREVDARNASSRPTPDSRLPEQTVAVGRRGIATVRAVLEAKADAPLRVRQPRA